MDFVNVFLSGSLDFLQHFLLTEYFFAFGLASAISLCLWGVIKR